MNSHYIPLSVACRLHSQLLADGNFGYEGSKEQFDLLYQELCAIAREEEPADERTLERAFHLYRDVVAAGDAEPDWFLYV